MLRVLLGLVAAAALGTLAAGALLLGGLALSGCLLVACGEPDLGAGMLLLLAGGGLTSATLAAAWCALVDRWSPHGWAALAVLAPAVAVLAYIAGAI